MIELYGMSSPNVRKIAIALEEMGLAYAVRHVAVFRGRQFDPAFLALNPIAKVPVLVDPDGPAGGEPIFESGAILTYLAECHGRDYLPVAGPARYAVLKWLFLQVANVGPALGNNSHFRRIADDNAYAAGRFRRMAAQVYRALDTRLAEAAFLGGADYSIADMATFPWARYFHRHGMRDADCPHLVAWMDTVAARPAVIRSEAVLAAMGRQDAADMAAATPEERERFLGLHIPAPTAAQAAAGRATSDRG
ncbi:glutathione S-transferase family protein [Sphingomonas solaris]|nr:glutathione S-transferase family protein [Sphingomonas solaris]